MAVRFMDGCDHYPDTDEGLLYKYDGITPGQWQVREDDGRFGGTNCIGTTGGFGALCRKQLASSNDKYHVIAWAFQVDNFISSADSAFMHAVPGSGSTSTWSLDVADTGVLKLRTNSSLISPTGVTRITTSSGLITAATYHFIEVELFVDDTNGYIRIWVNDVMEGEVTGDTAAMIPDTTNPVEEMLMNQAGIWATRYDDIHVLDGSGTVNTSRLGDTRVIVMLPASDGSNITFTPRGGNDNLGSVNEELGDGGITFVESGTPLNKDTYIPNGTSLGTIFAVQPLALQRKSSPNTITGAVIANNGSADFVAFQGTVGSDFKYMHGVFQTNPDTGNLWDSTSVSELEWGYKLIKVGT